MLCIIYTMLVGFGVALAGIVLEPVLPARLPRRGLWLVLLALSMAVPPLFRSVHAVTIPGAFATPHVPSGMTHSGLASSAPEWSQYHVQILGEWIDRVSVLDGVAMKLWLNMSLALSGLALIHAVRTSSVTRRAQREGPVLLDGVPVVVTTGHGPATVGLVRPCIVLPQWVMSLPTTERRFIVRHEQEHLRAHDTLVLFLASLALVVTPWNLPVWWQYRRLRRAVEVDCDQRVVRALGNAHAYGTILLRLAESYTYGSRMHITSVGFTGSLEHRLTRLVAASPMRRSARVIAAALAGAIFYLLFTVPHPMRSVGAPTSPSTGVPRRSTSDNAYAAKRTNNDFVSFTAAPATMPTNGLRLVAGVEHVARYGYGR